jgi:hypothetical protein
MTLREELVIVADSYGAARNIGRQRVSSIVLQRGSTLQKLADGAADVTTVTFERAMQWFSDNWPADTDWPEGVARPAPAEIVEAAE